MLEQLFYMRKKIFNPIKCIHILNSFSDSVCKLVSIIVRTRRLIIKQRTRMENTLKRARDTGEIVEPNKRRKIQDYFESSDSDDNSNKKSSSDSIFRGRRTRRMSRFSSYYSDSSNIIFRDRKTRIVRRLPRFPSHSSDSSGRNFRNRKTRFPSYPTVSSDSDESCESISQQNGQESPTSSQQVRVEQIKDSQK